MAKKISDLLALTAPTAVDLLPIVDDSASETKKMTFGVMQGFWPGLAIRPDFAYSDTDTLTIGSGAYHHNGTLEQIVYWDAAITFDLGSGGSNAASDDLGNDEWHYIYIDDSALGASPICTAASFLNDTTAPSWSAAKHGWYNGNDRCIFAVMTDGSAEILKFYHTGNFVMWDSWTYCGTTAQEDNDFNAVDVDTAWVDCYVRTPAFTSRVRAGFKSLLVSAAIVCTVRLNGSSGTGIVVLVHSTSNESPINSTDVLVDSSGILEIRSSVSGGDLFNVYNEGWHLPNGL